MSESEIFKDFVLQNNLKGIMDLSNPNLINKIIDITTNTRPIHIACNKGFFEMAEFMVNKKCNFEYSNKNGWRPLHHCCANGHLDIVQLLLSKDCEINCQTNDGMRPIHFACANGHFEIAKELIAKDCLLDIQTKQGWTSIHWAACNGHIEVMKLLIEKKCNTDIQDKDGCRPILIACAYGHIEIVKLLINNQNISFCPARDKWLNKRYEDYASWIKYLKKFFRYLASGFKDGVAPSVAGEIHLDKKCLEFLGGIQHSKQIFSCLKNIDCDKFSTFYRPITLMSIEEKTRISVLEFATENNLNNIIQIIMNKPVTDDEIQTVMEPLNNLTDRGRFLIEECFLYRCIKNRHMEGFKIFSSPQTINRPRKLVQKSFLEIAVEFSSRGFIKDILQKTIYDKEVWDRAKKDAEQNNQMEILSEISDREFVLSSRKEANLSILHTAVCDNNPDMVKYILDNPDLADKDMNNPRIGTALAFAHMLHHKLCIDILEQYNVDANTQNKLLETSLHEAIASGMHMKCQYLIDNSVEIDRVNSIGVTALHFAVIKGFEDLCEKLLRKGADCTRYIENIPQFMLDSKETILPLTTKENALTLCIKIHGTIYSCFLDNVSNEALGNIRDANENFLIHMAALCLQPEVCLKLLESGLVVDKLNSKFNTALMELLVTKSNQNMSENILERMISVVRRLVEFGSDINTLSVGGDSILALASPFLSECLMITLVSKSHQLNNVTETIFLFPFKEKWFDFADKLVNLLCKDFLLQNISKEIIQSCLEHDKIGLVKSLFDKASDDVQQSVLEGIIYHAAGTANKEFFLYMIDKDLKCPKLFENGETLLTNLLLERKFEFCKEILSSKNGYKHVRSKNNKSQYPMHVAIDVGDIQMIDELIQESHEFNEEDDNGRTPLTQLFEKLSTADETSTKIKLVLSIKTTIRCGSNIHKVMRSGGTAIDACTQVEYRNDIIRFYDQKKNNSSLLNNSV